jgi:hypothetical protein
MTETSPTQKVLLINVGKCQRSIPETASPALRVARVGLTFKTLSQKRIWVQLVRTAQAKAAASMKTAPKTPAKVFIARGDKKVLYYLTTCGLICQA